jgi:hypothetical protein
LKFLSIAFGFNYSILYQSPALTLHGVDEQAGVKINGFILIFISAWLGAADSHVRLRQKRRLAKKRT